MDDVKATIDRELSSTGASRDDGEDVSLNGLNYSSLKQREIAIQYLLERLGEFTRVNVANKGFATVGSNLPPIPTATRSIEALYTNQPTNSYSDDNKNIDLRTLSIDFQESSTFSLPDRLAHQVLNTTANASKRLGSSRGEVDVQNMMPIMRAPTLRSVGMQTTRSDPLLLGLPKSLAYEDILSREWSKVPRSQVARSLPSNKSFSAATKVAQQQRRNLKKSGIF